MNHSKTRSSQSPKAPFSEMGKMPLESPHIIDLRTSNSSQDSLQRRLEREIIEGLTKQEILVPGKNPGDLPYAYRKTIPSVALYDGVGLELYDQITAVEDYYPFAAELAILQAKGRDIACRLAGISTSSHSDSDCGFEHTDHNEGEERVVLHTSGESSPTALKSPTEQAGFSFALIELGAGSLKKTSHLLRNVAKLLRRTTGVPAQRLLLQAEYYALDLEPEQLRLTLSAIQTQNNSGIGQTPGNEVQTFGICGTYNQGLEWVHNFLTPRDRMESTRCRKAILWLGSSIGNFSPSEAVEFLRNELGRVLDTETRVLIGIDNCQVPDKVQRAYDDVQGVTRKFILNIIQVVARHLGLEEDILKSDQFDYVSRYNVEMKRHEAYLRARQQLNLRTPFIQRVGTEDGSIRIEAGELIMVERSYKFSSKEAYRLFDQAGLRVIQKWTDVSKSSSSGSGGLWAPTHTLYLVERATFHFVRTAPWPIETEYSRLSLPEFPAVRKAAQPPSKEKSMLQIWNAITTHFLSLGKFGHEQVQSPKEQISVSAENPTMGPEPMSMLHQEQTHGDIQKKKLPKTHTFEPQTVPILNEADTSQRNHGGIPSLVDWNTLWKAWDVVTLEMIPKNMLSEKPIDLRHAFLFYLGHIPVFADIHISRYLNEPNTEPQSFAEIFERGIDPNIDNPAECHSHSPFPDQKDEWPTLEALLEFKDKFRQRLTDLYSRVEKEVESRICLTRRLGRVLCMIYEHEAMHLETLLYMIQQMHVVNQPLGFTVPDWDSLAREWDLIKEAQSGKSELIDYPDPRTIIIGHDDIEEDDNHKPFSATHEFGWDNESPSRAVVVAPFKLEPTPITNEEYLQFLLQMESDKGPIASDFIPSSWAYHFFATSPGSAKHQIEVKTVYGHVNFEYAKHWPLQASGSQLACFAKFKGGRLPTADELRVYFSDNPIDHSAENSIGFLNWHPLPPERSQKAIDGRWRGGWNGGVWEWSSTKFEPHSNFKSSELYPGYSKDFFDGKHYVLLGGSWATVPRIAHRQSFVNWYQFKYPYVFAGGRVAYDY